jgi:uncharacterized protein YjeT (DUF2065 family)
MAKALAAMAGASLRAWGDTSSAHVCVMRRNALSCRVEGVCGSATMRRTGASGCAVVIGCLLLILSCGLSGMVVQQRLVTGPDLQLHLGSYRLVAYTTKQPLCPPYGAIKPTGLPCATDSLFASQEVYIVWLLRPGQPGDWREIAQQLVSLPLR